MCDTNLEVPGLGQKKNVEIIAQSHINFKPLLAFVQIKQARQHGNLSLLEVLVGRLG